MIIRPARPEDAAGVVAVQGATAAERRWIATQPEEVRSVADEAARIAAWTPRTGAVHVADEDSHILGLCGVVRGARLANAHTGDVGISVAPAHRGRGVGCALMLEAEAWARSVGVTRLTLGVFAHNARALHLYESLGCEREGVRRGHWIIAGEPVDGILMARRLGP